MPHPVKLRYLLQVAKIGDAERGDPVRVVRAISAVVNSVNDDGVLMGRWDGKGGTIPPMMSAKFSNILPPPPQQTSLLTKHQQSVPNFSFSITSPNVLGGHM